MSKGLKGINQNTVYEVDGRKLKYTKVFREKKYLISEYREVYNDLEKRTYYDFFPIHTFYDRDACKYYLKAMLDGSQKLINVLEKINLL